MGGSGATCWLTTGGAGAAAGGRRGATTLGLGGVGAAGTAAKGTEGEDIAGAGTAVAGGGTDAGNACGCKFCGCSPRSIESSRFVSRSIARTESHDDSAETSTLRSSLSGVPAAKIWISGWPLPGASSASAIAARMSA